MDLKAKLGESIKTEVFRILDTKNILTQGRELFSVRGGSQVKILSFDREKGVLKIEATTDYVYIPLANRPGVSFSKGALGAMGLGTLVSPYVKSKVLIPLESKEKVFLRGIPNDGLYKAKGDYEFLVEPKYKDQIQNKIDGFIKEEANLAVMHISSELENVAKKYKGDVFLNAQRNIDNQGFQLKLVATFNFRVSNIPASSGVNSKPSASAAAPASSAAKPHNNVKDAKINVSGPAAATEKVKQPKAQEKIRAQAIKKLPAGASADKIEVKFGSNLINASSGQFYRGVIYALTNGKAIKVGEIRVRPGK